MKVYGPYLRKDGRKHVIIIDRKFRKTVSYPRYLLEQVLGRSLTDDETVDHIDGDFTNNDISNLQILTRVENSKKQFIDNPHLNKKVLIFICPICFNEFQREQRIVKRNQQKRNCKGPYCSKSCASKARY